MDRVVLNHVTSDCGGECVKRRFPAHQRGGVLLHYRGQRERKDHALQCDPRIYPEILPGRSGGTGVDQREGHCPGGTGKPGHRGWICVPESVYTDQEMETLSEKYTYARPFTKESLLYREIFEKYYPGQAEMIAGFWMPNKEWEGCDVNDPSARVLSNYGESGK